MRVILLITGLGMGGAEKVVTSLADALVARGHEVCIAYLTGVAVVLPTNVNIQVVSLGMNSAADAFSTFIKLRQLIRDFQPDVVHSHMVHANILARLVRLVTPMPRLISTAHNSNEGGKLRMLAYRLTDALVDVSTNVSEEAVAAYIKAKVCRPGRIVAVHNGIATDAFAFNPVARIRVRQSLSIDEGCRFILAVGRFHEAKDYPNLLNALAELPVEDINYQVCIAGDGPLKTEMQSLVAQLGLLERVRFLGVRHDVADLMSASDVFVLSSAWEGFPIVVMEAMANERVLVVTDCGGVREAVGETGYLVKPKNSKALAQALEKALQLPATVCATLGRAARNRVLENYSLDAVVEKWLQIYEPNLRSNGTTPMGN
jgi:glycosyltransferase involved in cell wall biosynthesis